MDFICPSQYAKSHSFVTLSSTTTLVCIRALQFSSVEFNSLPLLSFIKCCVVRSHTGKFYTVLLFAAHHLLLCFSAALRVFLEIKINFSFRLLLSFQSPPACPKLRTTVVVDDGLLVIWRDQFPSFLASCFFFFFDFCLINFRLFLLSPQYMLKCCINLLSSSSLLRFPTLFAAC